MAEWEPQTGLLIAWPHAQAEMEAPLRAVIRCAASTQAVIIACHSADLIGRLAIELGDIPGDLRFLHAPNNSPWVRDYGPVSAYTDSGIVFLNFQFNGWGQQQPHDLDKQLTAQLDEQCLFQARLIERQFVLEGGGLSSDGRGTLLGERRSLFDSRRNRDCQAEDVARYLLQNTHSQLLALDYPVVQALAHSQPLRFAHADTLLVSAGHAALTTQTEQLCNAAGSAYQTVELLAPQPIRIDEHRHIQAYYSDYLLSNEHIFVPQLDDANDSLALTQLQALYPERTAVAIDALPLIRAGGNLRAACLNLHGAITY